MKPGKTLFYLLLLWMVSAIVTAFEPLAKPFWLGLGLFILVFSLTDLMSVIRLGKVYVHRDIPSNLALNVWLKVKLSITHESKRSLSIIVFDHYPQYAAFKHLPQSLTVSSHDTVVVIYQFKPVHRGHYTFEQCQVQVDSRLKCWRRNLLIQIKTEIRVYPNFAEVAKYALLATEDHTSQIGIRKLQRRGEGLEFHQLREYHIGDSLRQIDWKATSRNKKLISREYQDERGQQIIFLLDCGRRMRAKDDVLSHFDHALNAMLLLTYIALRQGDAVGVMTFCGDSKWIAPRKSLNTMSRILNHVYDIQPNQHSPDYTAAALDLTKKQKKRALIVLMTNTRDEDVGELINMVHLLQKRHLVLLTNLQEKSINQVQENPVNTLDDALLYAATQQYLMSQCKTQNILRKHGVSLLSVEPDQLAVCMVNRYLEIKRSGKL